jgi:hypothetical protein
VTLSLLLLGGAALMTLWLTGLAWAPSTGALLS